MSIYFDDSMIWMYRSGRHDDTFIPLQQTLKIKDSIILLEEIPDDFERPVVTHETITLTEIHSGKPEANQYRILYKYGIIVFHHTRSGEFVTVNYKGTGRFYIPANRIYLHLDDKGDVEKTLQDLLDDNEAIIAAISTLGDLIAQVNEFEHKGIYNPAVIYKKLSVVEDGDGNSYMAVAESVGASLSNTNYWRLVAKRGRAPDHQWVDGTKLQFEKPGGGWSEPVDLKGKEGPPGPPGTGDGGTYVHDQSIASNEWIIVHNMGYFPSVSVVDSSGAWCIGEVNYVDSSKITVRFAGEFSGKAYLS